MRMIKITLVPQKKWSDFSLIKSRRGEHHLGEKLVEGFGYQNQKQELVITTGEIPKKPQGHYAFGTVTADSRRDLGVFCRYWAQKIKI